MHETAVVFAAIQDKLTLIHENDPRSCKPIFNNFLLYFQY